MNLHMRLLIIYIDAEFSMQHDEQDFDATNFADANKWANGQVQKFIDMPGVEIRRVCLTRIN